MNKNVKTVPLIVICVIYKSVLSVKTIFSYIKEDALTNVLINST